MSGMWGVSTIDKGRLRFDGRQRILPRRDAGDLIALLQKVVADQFADVLFVFDHKHGLPNHISVPFHRPVDAASRRVVR